VLKPGGLHRERIENNEEEKTERHTMRMVELGHEDRGVLSVIVYAETTPMSRAAAT
jgi:hypothetical protein